MINFYWIDGTGPIARITRIWRQCGHCNTPYGYLGPATEHGEAVCCGAHRSCVTTRAEMTFYVQPVVIQSKCKAAWDQPCVLEEMADLSALPQKLTGKDFEALLKGRDYPFVYHFDLTPLKKESESANDPISIQR